MELNWTIIKGGKMYVGAKTLIVKMSCGQVIKLVFLQTLFYSI
jgi:hypothetical protein